MKVAIATCTLVTLALLLGTQSDRVSAQSSAVANGGATATVTQFVEPSPTNLGACHLHGDHWHCDGEEEGAHDHAHEGEEAALAEAASHEGHSHEGHSHAGHSHGPSAEFGCGIAPLEEYNLGLHVGAVFILLAASVAGVSIPEVMRWMRKGQMRDHFNSDATLSNVSDLGFGPRASYAIFALRFFGGGILLSTAFIHLVAHALVYFSNECIGALMYEATAPAIMMAAVWVMLVINFLIMKPIRQRAADAFQSAQGAPVRGSGEQDHGSDEDAGKSAKESVTDNESLWSERMRLQNKLDESELVTLEAGIIFHSIIIGVTIGTSSGTGWIAFLIAILWHQFCEGLALASRIVLLPSLTTFKVWLMYLAFCLTTPIGIAIGIGVRQSYNGNDRATLLAIGILTSISAGILLYSSFIQVIAYDFFLDKRMQHVSWARAFAAIAFFTLGVIVMSVLGNWA